MISTINSAARRDTVRAIADRMMATTIDGVFHHDDAKSLIPPHLKTISHYIFVLQARKLLNKEHGLVFETVRGEGYRRLRHVTGAQVEINKMLTKTRRTCRSGQRHASNAISFANDATESERRQVYQGINLGGLLEHLATLRTAKAMPTEPTHSPPDNFAWLRGALG